LVIAAEFFWIRPKRTSRLFDRTWLRWIEGKYLHPSEPKIPDTVGHIAFNNRHSDLDVFLGKHFGSRAWSSIGPNDYGAIEGWIVGFARRRKHKWRSEMQGWVQKVTARLSPLRKK
jgi:hypothetical protein